MFLKILIKSSIIQKVKDMNLRMIEITKTILWQMCLFTGSLEKYVGLVEEIKGFQVKSLCNDS
jgi:hypothetical protein